MSLLNSAGKTVSTQNADSLGGLLFRNVTPGSGYRVRLESDSGTESGPITVHSRRRGAVGSEHLQPVDPGQRLHVSDDARRHPAVDRRPSADQPGGRARRARPEFHFPTLAASRACRRRATPPPYPTLIEYSGYGYANPAGPENGIAVLANLMGFAVVDVNMRGTGCSGGAFDFFEPLQNLDGYDVIETIAHQPWVLDHKVGMMGISYGGISQLFTAQLQPPDLAAIAPLSVIDATATTLYPGGILNTGFAVAWAEQRQQNAEPAGPDQRPGVGLRNRSRKATRPARPTRRSTARRRTCWTRSKKTRPTTRRSPTRSIRSRSSTRSRCRRSWPASGRTSRPAATAPIWPSTSPARTRSGSRSPTAPTSTRSIRTRSTAVRLLGAVRRPPGADRQLGGHTSRGPGHLQTKRWGCPRRDVVTLPPDPIQLQPTYESALSAFEALPQIRVLFDNGAGTSPTGSTTAGDPYPGFEQSFSTFPIPGTTARYLVLRPGRHADRTAARRQGPGIDSYTSDASALPLTDFGSNTGTGGLWGNASQWEWNWEQPPAGSAVSYVSAPLTSNTTVDRRRRRAPVGEVLDARRRSAGDGQRGAPRRQRDVRAERLDPGQRAQARHRRQQHLQAEEHRARADPDDARVRRAADAGGQVRRRSSSRCTSRDTPTGRARASGSRSRHPTAPSRSGRSPRRSRRAARRRCRSRLATSMPSSLILPVVPGVSVPTGAARLPEPAQRALPAYQALVNRTVSH